MIVASHGANAELRMAEFGTSIVPPPGSGFSYGAWSWAGRLVSEKDALGLAAVASCIRLLSSQIASMPFGVYEGEGAERQPVTDSWQEELLEDPSPDWDSFTFMEDIVSSLEACANAFVQKIKPQRVRSGKPSVVELRPMDPDFVSVKIVNGKKQVLWWNGSKSVDATSQILHIRGFAVNCAPKGTGVIQMHTNSLGTHLAMDEYAGRYFRNDSRPSIVLSTPGNLTTEQRKELREGWNASHQGVGNAHNLGILWGGLTATPITPAMKDTQAVDLMEAALREACRMFGVDPEFLGDNARKIPQTPEQHFTKLFRMTLFPRCRRIEANFVQDPDLFAGSGLEPRFNPAEFLRADTATTAAVIHELVQVGVLTANEGRSMLGMPAHTDPAADTLQATPVGGAPNAADGGSVLNGNAPVASPVAATPGGE